MQHVFCARVITAVDLIPLELLRPPVRRRGGGGLVRVERLERRLHCSATQLLSGYDHAYVDPYPQFRVPAAGGEPVSTRGGIHADASFGEHGIARIDAFEQDSSQAVAVQADGKIVVAGWTSRENNITPYMAGYATSITLARLNIDGSLDKTFGAGGFARFDITGHRRHGEEIPLVQQADGKLLVGGDGLRRFTADGQLDTAFGQGGAAVAHGFVEAIGVNASGQIIIADREFNFQRFNADGTLDATFGSGGVATAPHDGLLGSKTLAELVVQPDGKIIGVGTLRGGDMAATKQVLTRLNADGTPDATFGDNGIVYTTGHDAGDYMEGYCVALQPDGKILAGGYGYNGMTLARYEADGSLDPSFGDRGLLDPIGSHAYSIAIAADGKIVLAGGYGGAAVFRLNSNGSPDTSFFGTGRFTHRLHVGSDSSSGAFHVVIAPDGDLVVAAQIELQNTVTDLPKNLPLADFYVLRLTTHDRAPNPSNPDPADPDPVTPQPPPVFEPPPTLGEPAPSNEEPAPSVADVLPPWSFAAFSGNRIGPFDFDDPSGRKQEIGYVDETLLS